MADQTAFFYGTLMAPKILYRACFGTTTPQEHQKQFIKIRPAIIRNYRRHRVKYVDYPGITPVKESSVLGTYVTGLSPQDLNRLDAFEGSEYQRREVQAQVLTGSVVKVQTDAAAGKQVGSHEGDIEEEVTTQTYVYLDSNNLETNEWDFEEFKREKMSAWTLESSEEYHDIPYDNETGTNGDGTGGRGAGGDITRQLDADIEGRAQGHEEAVEVARAAV